MRFHLLCTAALGLSLAAVAAAQDSPMPGQAGQRGGRGGWNGGMMGGRTMGTVTAVAADHYVIKTETGDSYTIRFSANTRILKQAPQPATASNDQRAWGMGRGGTPPQTIKASDIKVGDVIAAAGDTDEAAKSVGALFVMQIDPERAKQLREMQANFGKTWLTGRVTAVNEAKVTLQSQVDNAAHSFVADENTTFRKRRDPVTLADVQVGDNIRVEGAVKDGVFVAKSVSVMPSMNGGMMPREGDRPQ